MAPRRSIASRREWRRWFPEGTQECIQGGGMGLRSLAEKKAETLAALEREIDAWVASANGTGEAYLIPLSYYWDGRGLVFSTTPGSRTGRNLQRAGRARV